MMLKVSVVLVAVQCCSAFLFSGPSQKGIVTPTAEISAECEAMAMAGNCSFYDCFEARFQCGDSGYAVNYGGKYCRRLEEGRSLFTDAGNSFINRMAPCESQKLLHYYQQDTLNCNDFYNEAFVVMGQCYGESGYCDVVEDNFDGFMQTFDKSDLLNMKLVNQVMGAAKACGGDVYNTLISDFLHSGLGRR